MAKKRSKKEFKNASVKLTDLIKEESCVSYLDYLKIRVQLSSLFSVAKEIGIDPKTLRSNLENTQEE